MRQIFAVLIAVAASCIALLPAGAEDAFETKATQALMIDAGTGAVLYAKDPDTPFPPAALAKLMTMEMVFQAVREGRHSLDDTFVVSENAWRTGGAPSGGSTMFAALKSTIRLEDLIRGVIVQSANDGCIIIAEGFSGSEDKFAAEMTERARAIGLTASVFRNASGLPAEGQVVTARDLVRLGLHIWREYPQFYKYYAQPDFTWNKITQRNRNPLLTMGIGADGMGTGYTEQSGYAIVGSVERGGRRVFAALGGMKSERERAEEAKKMLDWGLSAFEQTNLFAAGEPVGEVMVFGGEKGRVGLAANGPVAVLVPTASRDQVSAKIVYDGPLIAPIERGAQVGTLKVWVGDTLSQEIPLYAAEAVGLGSIHRRALDAVTELLTGWIRGVSSS